MTVRTSLRFDSTADSLSGAAIALGTKFTAEVRMLIEAVTANTAYILDTDAGGDVSFNAFQVVMATAFHPFLHSNNRGSVTAACPMILGRSTMLSVAYDSAVSPNTRIYLNGTLVGFGDLGFSLSFPAGLFVGRRRYNPQPMNMLGLIEEIRLWTVARTQAEIQGDFNGPPSTTTGLYRYWPIEEGVGTTTTDTVAGSVLNLNNVAWSSEDWTLTPYPSCFAPKLLRQRQRDDVIRHGHAQRNAPTSRQASLRRGGRNTYW